MQFITQLRLTQLGPLATVIVASKNEVDSYTAKPLMVFNSPVVANVVRNVLNSQLHASKELQALFS